MRTIETNNQRDPVAVGRRSYDAWEQKLHNSASYAEVYAEEAAKSALWLQLVEARQQARLTQQQMAERLEVSQSQVARIEKQGYDAYTLNTLRRYVAALGKGFRWRSRTAPRRITPKHHGKVNRPSD